MIKYLVTSLFKFLFDNKEQGEFKISNKGIGEYVDTGKKGYIPTIFNPHLKLIKFKIYDLNIKGEKGKLLI